jgi:hypothetical protein
MTCIEVTHYRDPYGYGRTSPRHGTTLAHRQAWIEAHGPIPEGLFVLHSCDNPSCVNLEHLRLGTHADNMRDLAEHGHAPRGESHPSSILTDDERREIRQRYLAGERICDIADDYWCARSLVSLIARGKRWSP